MRDVQRAHREVHTRRRGGAVEESTGDVRLCELGDVEGARQARGFLEGQVIYEG